MNNRLIKILIAGAVSLCMMVTPVFGLEGDLQQTEQPEQSSLTIQEQNSQSENEGELTKAEVAEQTEVIEEDMKFLYVETKELVAPGTQNIAVGWKDDINLASDIVLVMKTPVGETLDVPESNRTEKSVLFTKDFASGSAGTYEIVGVRYNLGEVAEHFEFDDVEIDATFNVQESMDSVAVINIENNSFSKTEATEEIGEALSESEDAGFSIQANKPKNGKTYVVALDPGHSGSDCGAVNKTYGLNERTVNYKIAEYCKEELDKYSGVSVFYTYEKGKSTDLEKRAKAAKDGNADLVVSLHCNAINGSTRGCEVYYPNSTGGSDNFNTEGKALSNSIYNQLKGLGIAGRFIKSKDYPKSNKDYYALIRNPRAYGIMAIIVEHCYIDNNSDAKAYLSDNSKLKKLGVADATGIAEYLKLGKCHINEEGIVVDGDDNPIAGQFVTIAGNTYRTDENGKLITGFWKDTTGEKYYFSEEGIAESNKFVTVGENRYYLQTNGLVTAGMKTISGSKYFFDNEADVDSDSYGAMFKSESITGEPVQKRIGDAEYTFTTDGKTYLNRSKTKKSATSRDGAGTKYAKKGTVKKGTYFNVVRISGKWSQMEDGRWVLTSYTTKTEVYPEVFETELDPIQVGKLTAKYTSKNGPGTDYIAKKKFSSGATVTLTGTYGDWYHTLNGYWIPKSKIKIMGDYGKYAYKSWTFKRSKKKVTCSGGYLKGADISAYQGTVDWSKVSQAVKDHDLDFVILRCAGSPVTNGRAKNDSEWERNAKACEKYGIPYGVYLRSYAGSEAEARADAQQALDQLKGHNPDLPVYYDLESSEILGALSSKTKAQKKETITVFADIFCQAITQEGYKAGTYANLNWYTNYLNGDTLKAKGYDLWLAQWPTSSKKYTSYNYGDKYSIWQVCSVGNTAGYTHIPGIKGAVDLDMMVVPCK